MRTALNACGVASMQITYELRKWGKPNKGGSSSFNLKVSKASSGSAVLSYKFLFFLMMVIEWQNDLESIFVNLFYTLYAPKGGFIFALSVGNKAVFIASIFWKTATRIAGMRVWPRFSIYLERNDSQVVLKSFQPHKAVLAPRWCLWRVNDF